VRVVKQIALVALISILLLAAPLLSQTNPEPFSFKENKLGMSLEDFKALHRTPGHWERNKVANLAATDPDIPPAGASWEWMPDMTCKERIKAVMACDYNDTITDLPARATAILVDGKLNAMNLLVISAPLVLLDGRWTSAGDRTWQALIAKLGPPKDSQVTPNFPIGGHTRRILRWDNGISMVDFENDPCNKTLSPFDGIAELLSGHYCESPDTDVNTISVWYIHKALSQAMLARRKEAAESADKKARSDI
jgi:hypothetical protein